MEKILNDTKADEYELWFSDSKKNNFRYTIEPTYKANRTKPLPTHYGAVRKYLEEVWGAQVTPGQEADDALGINQSVSTIICSIDKDLKQVAGNHYNWVTETFEQVDSQQGLAYFYQQILTGDRTDNIISPCYRMGIATAQKLLAYCETEQDMFEVVQEQYNDDTKLLINGQLLWIRKAPLQIWAFPK